MKEKRDLELPLRVCILCVCLHSTVLSYSTESSTLLRVMNAQVLTPAVRPEALAARAAAAIWRVAISFHEAVPSRRTRRLGTRYHTK